MGKKGYWWIGVIAMILALLRGASPAGVGDGLVSLGLALISSTTFFLSAKAH
jgi:hypothetical protein